ncbi:protein kinase domain-containing protein [Nannocystis bainbridge]|uniref:Protein kinase n=1 Tax=Nannocystis bainbridge TaxID=2995303 RepID=A0ABT5E0Y2_9BACT|nr:serine/threonine-protein kinase [Nannocystis bainbridge]MDC0719545.1 protein kinase [Nannocystis bainbridge]
MQRGGSGADTLDEQIQAARVFAPGLEIQQIKSSVRARLFGTFDGAPTLGGYTLRRMIGRGGTGAVFEAVGRDGETVALKVLRGFEPAALYRFKLEFRALADISHPNLSLLHHLVVRGDQAFLTMELVDGVDFLSYVRQHPVRLRACLAQLTAGLDALHAAGKLHRDIKPSNVLVTREGRVVILDFGLVHELTAGRGLEVVGTPAYMAPEHVRAATPTPACDWYSVGVMLFEAMTGELPFAGPMDEVLRDKCERVAPPALGAAAEPPLAALCAALLEREPLRRAGGAEIAAVLREPENPRPWRAHAPPQQRGPASISPGGLIGRDVPYAAITAALMESRKRSVVTLLRGRSGLGKSALLRSFAEAAQAGLAGIDAPAMVLAGRCYEREQVPFNAFDSVIDALTGLLLGVGSAELATLVPPDIAAVARLFPVLRRVTTIAEACPPGPAGDVDAASLRHASAVLRDMFRRIADRIPLVVMVDDVQWGDSDSASLLVELLRGPDAPRCLVVLAASEGEALQSADMTALVERLRANGPVLELGLEPLRTHEATALAELLLRRGPVELEGEALQARAVAIAGEAGGVPLFVRELAHHVRTNMVEGTELGDVRLEAVVAERVDRLPAAAREMLAAVIVAGRPLEFEIATALSGGGRRDLQLLRVAHLVRVSKAPRGELVEAYHDRIRRAVLAGVRDDKARTIHGRIAEQLFARAGVPPELLADHLRAAGDRGRAAEVTRLAAQHAAEALAFRRAAELYRDAAALLPIEDVGGRSEALARAGEALAAAGRGSEAAECLLAAAALAPEVVALALRERAEEALRSGE